MCVFASKKESIAANCIRWRTDVNGKKHKQPEQTLGKKHAHTQNRYVHFVCPLYTSKWFHLFSSMPTEIAKLPLKRNECD